MFVAVAVAVFVGVFVAVGVLVGVGVAVLVGVGVAVFVGVGVGWRTIVVVLPLHGAIGEQKMNVSGEVKLAVLVSTVPLGVAALTATTRVNVAVANAFTVPDGGPQVTVPFVPTGGVVHVNPAGAVSETNVVLSGKASLRLTWMANTG
jgi:hypothetical protein